MPKSVIKRLNQLCSHFFWKGSSSIRRGARVSWQVVCKPKAEGGLGLKDILSWNQACMIQHLWSIFSRSGSLWIAWINTYVLKRRSIWQVPITPNCSWSWRKLLQLRELARQFVVRNNGIEVWKLSSLRYSLAEVWREIRPKSEKVTWSRLLWGSQTIPKHSIVVWMAILNRLPTMDRLISWGIRMNGICCLCQLEHETRDHMFYGCSYSRSIWGMILTLCGQNRMIGG